MSQLELDVGQLLWIGYEDRVTPELLARIAAGRVGVTVIFARNIPRQGDGQGSNDPIDIEALRQVNAQLAVAGPDGVRNFIAVDQEGGVVQRLRAPATRWPPMMTLNAAAHAGHDEQLAVDVGTAVGKELRAVGFDIDFAPILDVHTNPANPIIGDRAFGTTPDVVARRALAFARGLAAAGMLSCGKHFPGHGDTHTDSHLELPRIDHDWARLRSVELAPFVAAAAAGLPMLMTAHVVFSALDATVPATLSRHVMTTLLREEIGYRGVVVSDDLDMRAIAAHHGVGNAAIAAIRAGCDAILLCRDQAHQVQAEAALISEARADAGFATMIAVAAERVRAMKRAHEALQASVPVEPHSIGCEAHQALATQLRQ